MPHDRSSIEETADGDRHHHHGSWAGHARRNRRARRGNDDHASNERWFEVLLLGGLAGVFIVNALVAWLQPSDFVDLVERSMLSDLAPFDIGRWLAWAIGLNDLVLGVLLVRGSATEASGHSCWPAWASASAVTVVR